MSILIKGVEMPHDCDECKLCAFIPVGDYGINRKCMPLNARAEICIRRSDCPLIEIPPHGRLIDADKIPERFAEVRDLAPTIIPAEEDATTQSNISNALDALDAFGEGDK